MTLEISVKKRPNIQFICRFESHSFAFKPNTQSISRELKVGGLNGYRHLAGFLTEIYESMTVFQDISNFTKEVCGIVDS